MNSGKRKQGVPGATVPKAAHQHQLCSTWQLDSTPYTFDNRFGMPMEAAAAGFLCGDTTRSPDASIFLQARRWHRLHGYVRNITAVRYGFFNYGLLGKMRAQDRWVFHPGIRAASGTHQPAIDRWKEHHFQEIERVVRDVWMSWLIARNTVALWRKQGRVIMRPPETCEFTDTFGEEKLIIEHGLTHDQIDALPGLSASEIIQLKASGKLTLTHRSRTFFFSVLKDEPVGMGFGWPDLAAVFHACSLNEALVVGDRQLAEACRSVYEQHKLGHSINGGPHAGAPAHFMKKARAEAVQKEIKARKGHIQMATNFDHEIVIGAGRPNTNQYDAARYRRVSELLAEWGMPFAQMLLGIINPYLMTIARVLAHNQRQIVEPFLTEILNDAMKAPWPVRLQWDDRCFWDSRLLLDVLKSGLQSGPISGESFLHCAGFNPDSEREAKARDAALPKEQTLPIFDPAHGKRPGDVSAGKPAGKNDHR